MAQVLGSEASVVAGQMAQWQDDFKGSLGGEVMLADSTVGWVSKSAPDTLLQGLVAQAFQRSARRFWKLVNA